jgi:hypothetical protein
VNCPIKPGHGPSFDRLMMNPRGEQMRRPLCGCFHFTRRSRSAAMTSSLSLVRLRRNGLLVSSRSLSLFSPDDRTHVVQTASKEAVMVVPAFLSRFLARALGSSKHPRSGPCSSRRQLCARSLLYKGNLGGGFMGDSRVSDTRRTDGRSRGYISRHMAVAWVDACCSKSLT